MIGDAKVIENLRRMHERQIALLMRVLAKIRRGRDFELGPKGNDRDLVGKLERAVAPFIGEIEPDDLGEP